MAEHKNKQTCLEQRIEFLSLPKTRGEVQYKQQSYYAIALVHACNSPLQGAHKKASAMLRV